MKILWYMVPYIFYTPNYLASIQNIFLYLSWILASYNQLKHSAVLDVFDCWNQRSEAADGKNTTI